LEVGSWKWEVGSGKLEVRKLKKDHTKIIYMPKILVIDDERSIRSTLQEILEYEKHEVSLASSGPEGLEIFNADKFDIVLCDIKMPEMDGMEVLDKLMESSSDVPVVMISGHGNIDTAVAAIKKGAYDFIEKPLDLNRLLITVRNALDKSTLITETKILRKKISKSNDMIGSSSSMAAVKDMIEKSGSH
jgi:two-component system nitrogen regulation response regulator NtrX